MSTISLRDEFNGIRLRRDLLSYLVRAELKVSYSNKLLGYLWTILDPLALMVVYTIIVQYVFRRGGPQFPVLLFSCLLAWKWFASSVQGSVTSISSKMRMIQTVQFPKVVLPLGVVLSGLIRFLFGLLALVPMLFLFNANWTHHLAWLPAIIAVQFVLTAGICIFSAIGGVYFKDLQNILMFVLRVWFYLSPALYSVEDLVLEKYRFFFMLNPFAALFESYKNILVRGSAPSLFLIWVVVIAIVVFVAGFYFASRLESRLAKDS